MATIIQIKRSNAASAPSTLKQGEMGLTFGTGTQANLGDRLFIGDGSTVDVIGGKFFSDMLDHTQGTLTASSAISQQMKTTFCQSMFTCYKCTLYWSCTVDILCVSHYIFD